MTKSIKGMTFDFTITAILIFIGLITIVPFLYIVVVSFATPSEYIQKAGAFIFPSK